MVARRWYLLMIQLIASLTQEPSAEELRALAEQVAVLEVRADLVGGLDCEWLRQHFPGKLLFTLRSRAEGGKASASVARRLERIQHAVERGYDWIDLEAERDLTDVMLQMVPGPRRVISWHGGPASLEDLRDRLARMSECEAGLYKLVPEAERSGQELAPLALLRSVRRQDVLAFAAGEIGTWTRFVAPRLGAPLVFGALGAKPAAAGQLSIEQLVSDYGLPGPLDFTGLYGVVGDPVSHSLSPRLHNGLYQQLDLPFLYLPFCVESFGDFWLEVVESESLDELGFPLRGLSITAPHKRVALAVSGAPSPLAEWIGAANTMVRRGNVWESESTDPAGVVRPFVSRGVELSGSRAAVVGAGGAGRAAAVGLRRAGAKVTVVNRTLERAQKIATDLRVEWQSLEDFSTARFDVVVNATPVGRKGEKPFFDLGSMSSTATLVDLAYHADRPTALVEAARELGCSVVDGREVLLYQAIAQFEMMTGEAFDVSLAEQLLGIELVR